MAFDKALTLVNKDCSGFNYSVTSASGTTGEIRVVDYLGVITTTVTSVAFSGAGATTTGTIVLTTNGVYTLQWVVSSVIIDQMAIVSTCDIDCCLVKLVNELVSCDCNCAKCSKALAKAQKIYLLVKGSEVAADKYDIINNNTGYLLDAYNKYKKAKDICDLTCGCDC